MIMNGNEYFKIILGRQRCECQAVKHDLVNNCLTCGRIVCLQEGAGPCMFCGELVRQLLNFDHLCYIIFQFNKVACLVTF